MRRTTTLYLSEFASVTQVVDNETHTMCSICSTMVPNILIRNIGKSPICIDCMKTKIESDMEPELPKCISCGIELDDEEHDTCEECLRGLLADLRELPKHVLVEYLEHAGLETSAGIIAYQKPKTKR